MASWEEKMEGTSPSKMPTYDMDILHSATEADLKEAYESHQDAQQAFWNTITTFLAKHGSLLYEHPNFDSAHFTTGPMALKEV